MSELKVINLGNILESIENNESVYYEYYAKSEVDKVIAELKERSQWHRQKEMKDTYKNVLNKPLTAPQGK